MRHNHHVKHAFALPSCIDADKPLIKSLMGKPLFISLLTLCFATPVLAQQAVQPPIDSPYVDISDPNVSIDLSVLDDGGRQAEMSYQASRTVSAPQSLNLNKYSGLTGTLGKHKFSVNNTTHLPPDVATPTSTLYIQPSTARHLPPQTKELMTKARPNPNVKKTLTNRPFPQHAAPKAMAKASPPSAPALKSPPALSGPAKKIVAVETPEHKAAAPVKVAALPVPKDMPPKTVPPPKTVSTAPAPAAPIAAPVIAEVKPVHKVAPKVETRVAIKTITPPPQALRKTAKMTKESHTQMAAPVSAPVAAPKTMPNQPSHAQPSQTQPSHVVVVDLPPKPGATSSVASLPSATKIVGDGDNMRIVFEASSAKLPKDAREALKGLAAQIQAKDTLRLQLLAYAGNADTSASAARRLSLSRALAVRSYLIESGVRSTRIDVRALGNKSSDDVTERVDITVVER